MKAKVFDLTKKEQSEISLNKEIFGLENIREDIIKRVIDWQLLSRMSGTHKTRTVSEVSGTTKKPFKQKGTGNARQGSLRSVHMRGGAVSHGPQVRSHAISMPKKVRKMALKHAISSKSLEGKLIVVDSLNLKEAKTSKLSAMLKEFGAKSYFVVDGAEVNVGFKSASRNIPAVVSVPAIGANVYDIIKHDVLMVTKDAVKALEERLGDE